MSAISSNLSSLIKLSEPENHTFYQSENVYKREENKDQKKTMIQNI